MEIYCCPEKLLDGFGIVAKNRLHAGFIISSLIVLLLTPILAVIPHACLFRLLLGLPCPGCGIIHSITSLLKFDIASALRSNPAGLLIVVCVLYQLIARPAVILRPQLGPWVNSTSKYLGHAALAGLLGVWLVRLISN
jgi:hypothetical protein